jgi:hypothetical protein
LPRFIAMASFDPAFTSGVDFLGVDSNCYLVRRCDDIPPAIAAADTLIRFASSTRAIPTPQRRS